MCTGRSGGHVLVVAHGPDAGSRVQAWKQAGQRVRVLWCGTGSLPAGVDGIRLDSVAIPKDDCLVNLLQLPTADRSDRIRHAVEVLHQAEAFDWIEFPCRGGLGFRTMQAHRQGGALAGVQLVVYLDSTADSERQQQQRLIGNLDDLELDYCERQAFELADVRVISDPVLLDYVRQRGWTPLEQSPPLASRQPLVTVCVPYYNLGRFLPCALHALARQTYPALEVLVIDDGSTEDFSRRVFAEQEKIHRHFRFLRQQNAGIGATRNRGLFEARGEFFLPVDADNVACPNMVERLVAGMNRRPDLAALSCYFHAFREQEDLHCQRFHYACRPTGGPHVLGCFRNVYGDANALYRTDAFRSVGGYETDRGTSFEDWEAFVKLVQAGYRVDVLPEVLFYYRHLSTGFSRSTRAFANQQRVLRAFRSVENLPMAERQLIWAALAGLGQAAEQRAARDRRLPYRVAEGVIAVGRQIAQPIRQLWACLTGL